VATVAEHPQICTYARNLYADGNVVTTGSAFTDAILDAIGKEKCNFVTIGYCQLAIRAVELAFRQLPEEQTPAEIVSTIEVDIASDATKQISLDEGEV
jgi:hypothetical protein